MFLGHYAAGMAAKRFAPGTSLGTLLLAAIFVDLLWPLFILAGIEDVRIVPGATEVVPLVFDYYPFSHSLLAVSVWAVLFGCAYHYCRKPAALPLAVLALAVISHWLLDAIVHAVDLPLTIGGQLYAGLGLWGSALWTGIAEGGIFAFGAWVYLKSTRPLDFIGRYGIWVFMLLLLVIYAGQFSGAAPPDVTVLALTGLSQAVLVLLGAWIDRHRVRRVPGLNCF